MNKELNEEIGEAGETLKMTQCLQEDCKEQIHPSEVFGHGLCYFHLAVKVDKRIKELEGQSDRDSQTMADLYGSINRLEKDKTELVDHLSSLVNGTDNVFSWDKSKEIIAKFQTEHDWENDKEFLE